MREIVEIRYRGQRAFATLARDDDGKYWLNVVVIDGRERLRLASEVSPANADDIMLAEEAQSAGIDVAIPAPTWEGVEYDYDEDEFIALINSTRPTLAEGDSECFALRGPDHLFPRKRVYRVCEDWTPCPDGEEAIRRYALVKTRDGRVVEVSAFWGGWCTALPADQAEGLPEEWQAVLAAQEQEARHWAEERRQRRREALERQLRENGLL